MGIEGQEGSLRMHRYRSELAKQIEQCKDPHRKNRLYPLRRISSPVAREFQI